MPVKSTRQRLLEMLSNQDQVSAAEISRALAVTQADVRYHLTMMEQEGLILTVKPKHSGRRGRPARRFSLASKTMQDNYEILTSALLSSMRKNITEEERNRILHEIARQLPGEFKPDGPLGRRLMQAVDRLNLLNYQARWEAHADAPRVIFDRCPFASLRPEYPELCLVDAYLLSTLLDEPVVQIESSAHLPAGYCLFNISQKTFPDR